MLLPLFLRQDENEWQATEHLNSIEDISTFDDLPDDDVRTSILPSTSIEHRASSPIRNMDPFIFEVGLGRFSLLSYVLTTFHIGGFWNFQD